MRIITKHNRAKVTFCREPDPGTPFAEDRVTGVELEILNSDSDPYDTYAYVWLSPNEVERLANGLLQIIKPDKKYVPGYYVI